MTVMLAYLLLLAIGSGAIGALVYAFSRRNAYRTDGIDNLGGAFRRWCDRRVEANRDVARSYAFRAQNQHAAFMAGDPYGLYGHYPPADL